MLAIDGVARVDVRLRERKIEVTLARGNSVVPDALAEAIRGQGFTPEPFEIEARGTIQRAEASLRFELAGTDVAFPATLGGDGDVPAGAGPVVVSGLLAPPYRSGASRLRIRELLPDREEAP